MRRAPGNLRLLAWGGAGNLAIALVWLVSRLVGLPFGPEPWQPEAIGWKDVLASYDEVLIAILVATLVLSRFRRPAPSWTVGLAWVLVAVSVLAAFLGGH